MAIRQWNQVVEDFLKRLLSNTIYNLFVDGTEMFFSQLTVACIKMNRPEIAENAIKVVERRIARDKWPEYYDTKGARFIGKQARLFQTWSIAGYLVAKLLVASPNVAKMLINIEDSELVNAFSYALSANPKKKRPRRALKQSYII